MLTLWKTCPLPRSARFCHLGCLDRRSPMFPHAFVMNLCSIRRVLFLLAVALHRVVSFISVGFRSHLTCA